MRIAGTWVGVIILVSLGAGPARAQAPSAAKPTAPAEKQAGADEKPPPNNFSGIKLVDPHAGKPEQTVSVRFQADKMAILDLAAKSEIASLPYEGLTALLTVSPAPPAIPGQTATATRQPTGMGKTSRNWITLQSGSNAYVFRVSEQVYGTFRQALEVHKVEVTEEK